MMVTAEQKMVKKEKQMTLEHIFVKGRLDSLLISVISKIYDSVGSTAVSVPSKQTETRSQPIIINKS